jgi:hypothetical protein
MHVCVCERSVIGESAAMAIWASTKHEIKKSKTQRGKFDARNSMPVR